MENRPRIRVLVGKAGLDGHDRGAKIIAKALRDAGMEVVYTGLRQTPEMIAETALQEDVDIVGISILSGAHMTLVPAIRAALDDREMGEVPIIIGGIVPQEDHEALHHIGVRAIFGPGTNTNEIANFVESLVQERGSQASL